MLWFVSDKITNMSAVEITRQIKERKITPTEVTEAHLNRIYERNGRTNAFVTVTEELARENAYRAEQDLRENEPLGPLHGVPVAIKDLTDVKGVPTTSGSLLFENHIAESDSILVDRLKSAGAVIVGKTNTPEFGLGTTTDNRVSGPTRTPFDPARVSGGSSGGAGAALGDSLVPLAPGSDAGGSIRIPASFCGVYGLKPTFGLVPSRSRPNAFSNHTPMSLKGPMARTVEDAALLLDVMSGVHPRDPLSQPSTMNFRTAIDQPIDTLKIAYTPALDIYPVQPAIREILDDAITAFEHAGATVDEYTLNLGHTQNEILDAYYTMAIVRWRSLFFELERQGLDPYGEDRHQLRPYLKNLINDAKQPTIQEYKRADIVRTHVFDGLQDCFEEYDLIISSTLSTLPFLHGEEPVEINGTTVEPMRGWVLTQPYNLSGHPAASIPAGFVDGLPVGMQIAGQRYADDTVIAASAAYERKQPWEDVYPS